VEEEAPTGGGTATGARPVLLCHAGASPRGWGRRLRRRLGKTTMWCSRLVAVVVLRPATSWTRGGGGVAASRVESEVACLPSCGRAPALLARFLPLSSRFAFALVNSPSQADRFFCLFCRSIGQNGCYPVKDDEITRMQLNCSFMLLIYRCLLCGIWQHYSLFFNFQALQPLFTVQWSVDLSTLDCQL
jgi:hypothetical protein